MREPARRPSVALSPLEAPCDLGDQAPFQENVVQPVLIVELGMRGLEKVLAANTGLGPLADPPAQPRIQPGVAGGRSHRVTQRSDIEKGSVPIQSARQIQIRAELKLPGWCIARSLRHV